MVKKTPEKIIIAAMSENRIIGSGDGMPWNIREEYQQFLDFVAGNVVIMGRRTFQIFGADLNDTTNIVISRSLEAMPNATVCPDPDAALRTALAFGKTVFVAGGATIYRQFLDRVDKMYLSVIHGDFNGDTEFPRFDSSDWDITETRHHTRFTFTIYQRKSH